MADPSTLFGIEGAFIPMHEVKGAFDLHLAVFCEEWREREEERIESDGGGEEGGNYFSGN